VSFSILRIGVRALSTVTIATPEAHAAGEEMILDCDFDFEESEATQLDLKWYFNGSLVPIYQWVPSLDLGPQVLDPMFKDNLDLKYQAHSEKLILMNASLGATSVKFQAFLMKLLQKMKSLFMCHLIMLN